MDEFMDFFPWVFLRELNWRIGETRKIVSRYFLDEDSK